MAAAANTDFDAEFEHHLHKIFYVKQTDVKTECDQSIIEYFGVLGLTDVNAPERKLWYIYYCKQPEIDQTVDRIFQKYGKKNLCELFRKPIFCGVSMRTRVKKHFAGLRWYVKGNLLEAPPKSHYTDERMAKAINDLYFEERKMLYNYICMKHNDYSRYCK